MNMTKTIKILSLIIIALFVLASCGGGSGSGKAGAGKLALKISFEDKTRAHRLSKVEGLSSLTLDLMPKSPASYTPQTIDLMPYYNDNSSSLTINSLTDGETYYAQIKAYDNSGNMTYYGSNSVVIQPGATNGVDLLAKINSNKTYENSMPTFTATKKTVSGQERLDLSVSGGGVTEASVYQSSNTGSFAIVSSDTDSGSSITFSSSQSLKNDGKHSDGSANDNLWNQRYSFATLTIGDTFKSVVVFTNVFGQPDIASINTAVVAGTTAATYTISGTVGVAGATVTLSGTSSATTVTNSSGSYTFSSLQNGSYTVTPSVSGYTFTPTSKSVTVSNANQTGQDFTATASAPSGGGSVQLPRTGQTTSYATGDDGALQKGVAWPNPRFTDNGNGTVTDGLTGLVWLKNANCFSTQTWTAALSSANTLANGACGLTDGSTAGQWRLPNRKELRSLADYSKYSPALPTGHPFSNVQSGGYWSGTTYAFSTSYAWGVYMVDGVVAYDDKTYAYYVWPVR